MTQPLTPLDTFRSISQYNPWHFWGLAGGSGPASVTKPSTNANNCRPVLRQYGWQAGDAVSRVQIAQTLIDAERLVRTQIEHPIAPQFLTAKLPWPDYYDRRLINPWPIGSDGRYLSVTLPDGELQAVGVESITLLDTNTIAAPFPFTPWPAAVGDLAYFDLDGDNLVDTAVVVFTDSDTPLDEIQLYVPEATGDGKNGRFDFSGLSERWRIRPTHATRSGTTVTIRADARLFIRPVLYEGVPSSGVLTNGLDPAVDTNYLQSVDICRRRCDSSGTTVDTAQAKLIWNSQPWPWCACPASGSDPAGTASAVARVGIRDAHLGEVTPAQAVFANNAWHAVDCIGWWNCRPPDKVEVRYLAGRPLEHATIAPPWDRLIVGMAAAMLARPLAGCQDVHSLIDRWQTDPTRAAGGATFQAQPRANNPFGTRVGQIDAWAQVQYDRITRGLSR